MKTMPTTLNTFVEVIVVDPQDEASLALALARLGGAPSSLRHRTGPFGPRQVRP